MSRLITLFVWMATLALAGFSMAGPVVVADLRPEGVEIGDQGGDVRITIPMTQPVPWKVRLADGPPRLIIEFRDLALTREPRLHSTSIMGVETHRTGADRSELVAHLREPLTVVTAEMRGEDDGGATLEVKLQTTTATAFRAEIDMELSDAPAEIAPEPSRLTIALDPGHGGFDPGAEAGDLTEADLTLAFARRLKEVLLRSGRLDVVLTREEDSFVSLDERLTRARAAGADVFLSLHADALEEEAGAASGLVVYSQNPSEEMAAATRLTERHAGDDLLTGVDLTKVGDDVTLVLLELAQNDTAPRTLHLSRTMVGAFEAAGLKLNSRPERDGDFAVLKAADIPSILLELGFLSTDGDLERLTSEAWQTEAARAIRDAVLLWEDEDRLFR